MENRDLENKYASLNEDVKNEIRSLVNRIQYLLGQPESPSLNLDQDMMAVLYNPICVITQEQTLAQCFIRSVTFKDNEVAINCDNAFHETKSYHRVLHTPEALLALRKCLHDYVNELTNKSIIFKGNDVVGAALHQGYQPTMNDVFSYLGQEYYAEEYTHPVTQEKVYRIAKFVGWVSEEEYKRIY